MPNTGKDFLADETVVIGARGMLGTELADRLRKDGRFGRIVAADRRCADITDGKSLEAFFAGLKPSFIFNCAAHTDVDACESSRDYTFDVNAEGAGRLGAFASRLGALLIHVSTDYVFDGIKGAPYAEEDKPAPISVYGESKLEGERLVIAHARDWVIVRTSWLYGANGTNFVDLIRTQAEQMQDVVGVTDQIRSPTWTRDLASALMILAESGVRGVFHVANSGACSRYEQAQFIVDHVRPGLKVRPVKSAAFSRSARVPAYSALNTNKFLRETGCEIRPWQNALSEYLSECARGNAESPRYQG